MTRVRVKYYSIFRDATAKDEEQVEFGGKNLRSLIEHLIWKYGYNLEKLLIEDMKSNSVIRQGLVIMVDGSHAGTMDAPVEDDSEVAIMPITAGG